MSEQIRIGDKVSYFGEPIGTVVSVEDTHATHACVWDGDREDEYPIECLQRIG